jgi:protein archease
MTYRFVENLTVADVAFQARGKTLEALFRSAGKAVTAVMVKDLRTIRSRETRQIRLSSDQLDLLLFNFLQEIIFYKDADQLLLRSFALKITRNIDGSYALSGTGGGERIDRDRHRLLVDVKAVTMHRFKVVQDSQGWEATVVLDI